MIGAIGVDGFKKGLQKLMEKDRPSMATHGGLFEPPEAVALKTNWSSSKTLIALQLMLVACWTYLAVSGTGYYAK